jgi:hypothetical protein
LLCSGARRRALTQTIDIARGLDINSSLSAENHLQDLQLHRHQQYSNPNSARGSTTTSPPIVDTILRQQLDYVIVDYAALTTPHPIKAKFSSSKS